METLASLAKRATEALTAAGFDPRNVDFTAHISETWASMGLARGEAPDWSRAEATQIARQFGGEVDGPLGNGFVARRVDGVGITVSCEKRAAVIPAPRDTPETCDRGLRGPASCALPVGHDESCRVAS